MSTAQSEARAESCEADRPDFNRDTIHAHISILHRLAKLSAADGVLVLACYGENPNTGRELRAQVQRFEIGDIDLMVETIMGFELQPHINVYAPWAICRRGLTGSERGGINDIVCTLALVVDLDADTGMAGDLPLPAPYVIETSPGNSQPIYPLLRALPDARQLALALGEATGGDYGTKDIAHVWRVPGTLNWPNKKKVDERNRPRAPQPVKVTLAWNGELIDPDVLLAASRSKAAPKKAQPHIPTGRTVDETVEEIVADRASKAGGDRTRSGVFFSACKAARAAGMMPDDLEDLMRRHPFGCAAKYLEPYDRLHKEIERAWGRLRDRGGAAPTYAIKAGTGVDEARRLLRKLIDEFFVTTGVVVQHALSAMTGIGKTRIAARAIAEALKAGKQIAPVGYAVPTHRLGEDIADQFRQHGVTAAVWRGRKAFVSGKDGPTMCGDLPSVRLAEKAGVTVESACCKGKNPSGMVVTCPLFDTCAYQAQKRQKPDVWLFAHQMLFQKQSAIKNLSALFIDESFQEAGQSKPKTGVTLDEIENVSLAKIDIANDLEPYRRKLAQALRTSEDGGVPRTNLIALSPDDCTAAIKLEWQMKKRIVMWPGMSINHRTKVGGNAANIHALDRVWRTVRELLADHSGDVVSGRLFLMDENTEYGKARVVKTRGVRPISEQYKVPVMIMDATLPSELILKKWFPDVEIVGRIEAPMPHVHTRQILGAPITKKKLLGAATDRSLQAIRRYVLKRWVECGRGQTLVICQKEVRERLADRMPNAIHLEHFNAIAGLDGYRDVRLLITIGRTVPSPFEVEAAAGLLSGIEPVKASIQQNGGTWFDRVERGVRLKSGAGVAVPCDQHPDALAEAVRWQVCEGELIQAIGRGRGVNRTAETPLDIDILADVVLPLEVDQVAEWVAPGKETEMEAEGVWLDSPTDITKAWPAVWASPEAAKEWKKTEQRGKSLYIDSSKGKPPCARYQLPGDGQKWKDVWYAPDVITDLRGWLEARLGPLAGFEAAFPRLAVDIGVPAGGKITLEMVMCKGAAREVRVAFSEMRYRAKAGNDGMDGSTWAGNETATTG